MSSFDDSHAATPPLLMSIHMVCIVVLSSMATLRTPTSLRTLRALPLMRLLVAGILAASVFCLAWFLVMLAAGTARSASSCEAAMFTWLFGFFPQKILIHCFLAERMHLSNWPLHRRTRSPAYAFLTLALTIAGGLGVYCITARQVVLTPLADGGARCEIGIRPSVSVGILVVHVATEVTYLSFFVWGLMGLSANVTKGKRLIVRSLIASAVSLCTSFANYLHLPLVGGRENAWIVMAIAGADITLNAIVIFSITSPLSSRDSSTTTAIGTTACAFRSPLDPSPPGHPSPLPSCLFPHPDSGMHIAYDADGTLDVSGVPSPSPSPSPGLGLGRRASVLSQAPRSPRGWRPRELEQDLAGRGLGGSRLRGSVTTFVSLPRVERGEVMLEDEGEEKEEEEDGGSSLGLGEGSSTNEAVAGGDKVHDQV